MNLMWRPWGPKMSYRDGVLTIEDLNPEAKLTWRMSRGDMLRLAWRCFRAGVRDHNDIAAQCMEMERQRGW